MAQRNISINQRLKSLIAAMDERIITDLQMREREIIKTRERTKVYIGSTIAFLLLALVISYFVIMRDFARRERGRRKLEESNRQNAELLEVRKKIILTISHNIRSPLNNINGYTELAMNTRDKKKRNQQLEKVIERCKHILHLVNNLLDVYRLNETKETSHPTPFKIADLLNRVADGVTHQINDKGLVFGHRFVGTDVMVKGDIDRIEQVINNLIANAVKFTPAGQIDFNATYRSGTLTLEVRDTGIGMSEELVERIFIPFERAANAENIDGYGLGLPIVKGTVTMLGGTINVKSSLGEGTTMTVTLPLPLSDECVEEEPAALFDSSMRLPKKVIVIDDDKLQIELVKEMLERNGIFCTACTRGDKLTEELRKRDYDLLLTDIQMPNTDGFKLLKLLRKSRIGNSQDIPIVAMTARNDNERSALLAAGFDGCIFKPFAMNDLLRVLSSVIKGDGQGAETDFSTMLANVSNKRHILTTMIETCEKDIADFKLAMTNQCRETLRGIVHRISPMWEMLAMDGVLSQYHTLLKDSESDLETIFKQTGHIITQIEQMIKDARKEIERIDEEKNTDSRG